MHFLDPKFDVASLNVYENAKVLEKIENLTIAEIGTLKLWTNAIHEQDKKIEQLHDFENTPFSNIDKCAKIQSQYAKSCSFLHESWKKEYDPRFSRHIQYYHKICTFYEANILNALEAITNKDIRERCFKSSPNERSIRKMMESLETLFHATFNNIQLVSVFSRLQNDYAFANVSILDSVQNSAEPHQLSVLTHGLSTGRITGYGNRQTDNPLNELQLPNIEYHIENTFENEPFIDNIIQDYCYWVNNAFDLLFHKEQENRTELNNMIDSHIQSFKDCNIRTKNLRNIFAELDNDECIYIHAHLQTIQKNLMKLIHYLGKVINENGFGYYNQDIINQEEVKWKNYA